MGRIYKLRLLSERRWSTTCFSDTLPNLKKHDKQTLLVPLSFFFSYLCLYRKRLYLVRIRKVSDLVDDTHFMASCFPDINNDVNDMQVSSSACGVTQTIFAKTNFKIYRGRTKKKPARRGKSTLVNPPTRALVHWACVIHHENTPV